MHHQPNSITAYPETEAIAREMLAVAVVDVDSFQERLHHCALAQCHGMCCYDGVYIGQETAEVIEELVRVEAQFFAELGLDLPETVIVESEWKGKMFGKKTAVKPRPFSSYVDGFPSHFEDTACVFCMQDGRCALQVLSQSKGLHPWYYKPFPCWMHPLYIALNDSPIKLVVYNNETDPFKLPNYDGFATQTFCGRISSCGTPAYQILENELEFLGRIAERDFFSEITHKTKANALEQSKTTSKK